MKPEDSASLGRFPSQFPKYVAMAQAQCELCAAAGSSELKNLPEGLQAKSEREKATVLADHSEDNKQTQKPHPKPHQGSTSSQSTFFLTISSSC